MNSFLKNKRILITGGSGFLGKVLVRKFNKQNLYPFTPSHKNYNLIHEIDVKNMYLAYAPDVVIHCAAIVGGIGANKAHPAEFLYNNMSMGLNLIEYAHKFKVEKFVTIGTVCAYPKYTPVPFKENDIWEGYPEETNAPYGLAKRMLLAQSQAYRQQYGLNAIYLIPVNMYGNNDNFNPNSSHVIPALIKKCFDAIEHKQDFIEVWGTGHASREFIHVEDVADAIIFATERYDESEPVNIGTGKEITIHDLVTTIALLSGFMGEIRWNSYLPDGQPRRCLDVTKAKDLFGFEAKIPFIEGLKQMINWYKNNLKEI